MARTTFTIPDEMLEALGEINKQTGIPVSKLIRDGIVLILAQHGYEMADKSAWGGKRITAGKPDELAYETVKE